MFDHVSELCRGRGQIPVGVLRSSLETLVHPGTSPNLLRDPGTSLPRPRKCNSSREGRRTSHIYTNHIQVLRPISFRFTVLILFLSHSVYPMLTPSSFLYSSPQEVRLRHRPRTSSLPRVYDPLPTWGDLPTRDPSTKLILERSCPKRMSPFS